MAEIEASHGRRKEPSIKLVVHVEDLEFPICCGGGDQDFKWLGLAVSQRYQQLSRPFGRIRQREILRVAQGNLIPQNVFSPREARTAREVESMPGVSVDGEDEGRDDGFLHPKAKIKDVLCDGDHIWVELNHEGGVMTRWHSEAFCYSEGSKMRREAEERRQRGDQLQLLIEERKHIEKTAEERRQRISNIFPGRYTETIEEIATDFEQAWSQMSILELVRIIEEQDRTKQVMEANFIDLRDGFLYYNSVGSTGTVDKISYSDFFHMCYKCDLSEYAPLIFETIGAPPPDLEDLKNRHTAEQLFELHHFLEALLRIALLKMPRDFELKTSMQLSYVLYAHIIPHFEVLQNNDFRQLLWNENVRTLLRNKTRQVYALFRRIAGNTNLLGISIDGLINLLTAHANGLAPTPSLGVREIRSLAIQAQTTEIHVSENFDVPGPRILSQTFGPNQRRDVFYCEFLEIIVQCAQLRYTDATMPLDSKLESTLNALKT